MSARRRVYRSASPATLARSAGAFLDGLTPVLLDTVVGCIESTPLDSVDTGLQPVGGDHACGARRHRVLEPRREPQHVRGGNYPRLAALEKRYDPENLIRLTANIKPAA
jgi:Berberine and berberine like